MAMYRAARLTALFLPSVLWLGCGSGDTGPLAPPLLTHDASHTISGSILDAHGASICGAVEGTIFVRLLNPEFGFTSDERFLGEKVISCPTDDNAYSFPVDAGVAHVRVDLPELSAIGALPWRSLDEVTVGATGFEHNVNLLDGTPLGGSATLDGSPFEGVFLQLLYDFNPNFTAAFGGSGADGRWNEFFGRSPMILQNGKRFQTLTDCGDILGTRVKTTNFTDAGFTFPSQVSGLNCALETGRSTQFSHTFTRVAVTPLPGDVGGAISGEFFDQFGVGWGVQFPVARGTSPIHGGSQLSELFNGGLIIGIGTNQVLTGVDAQTMMECGATCRDLGLDGTVKFSRGTGRRQVKWRYTDAGSAEAVGLEIKQKSVDGKRPNDYVLFRFSIKNTSRSTITFHAGFFGDWDIDLDGGDDLGGTELGGKLMYEVSQDDSGIHAGTLLLGAPITGNFFFDGITTYPSTAEQVRALRGTLRQETLGPGDLRYIQGAGPITLKRNQSRDLWIAVVAGENKAELLANARAAQADVSSRLNEDVDDDRGMDAMMSSSAVRGDNRAGSRMKCKACKPQ